jgi:hypothetical protein
MMMIILWETRWLGHVVCMGEKINSYKMLVGKSEETRPVRQCRYWHENIKMYLRETGRGSVR